MTFIKWLFPCAVYPALLWCCIATSTFVTANEVTANEVTGSAVTGSAVTGSAVTGSAVTGSDVESPRPAIIDFRDPASIKSHRPIVIAHRGGVISDDAPECSLTALRRAADVGFDMVELDVQVSRDGMPVLFHDRTLAKACGRDGRVVDYSLRELEGISYKGCEDSIVGLNAALRLCRELQLGVMLDLKSGRESSEFLRRLKQLLVKHGLLHSTITFSGTKQARQVLAGVRFTPTDEEMKRLRAGEKLDLANRFWFGLPRQLAENDISRLHDAKALVLPAINTFRYAAKNHMVSAQKDIRDLTRQGVDGFQIDSVYVHLLESNDKVED